jgi:hypothetical protein
MLSWSSTVGVVVAAIVLVVLVVLALRSFARRRLENT